MLQELKQEVFEANLDLVKYGLVIFTWGNVSGIDREKGLVVIKPSGLSYHNMKAVDMVVLDMEGKVVEGKLKPSIDAATHLVLYHKFPNIGGVTHTHSTFATAWAQAGKEIPNIGTTHADYFKDAIPCTRPMTEEEIANDYERETGKVIAEHFERLNPDYTPGIIVNNHGVFTWGIDARYSVHNAVVLEQIAKMAFISFSINPELKMKEELIKKHFFRKHGAGAYYGQNEN